MLPLYLDINPSHDASTTLAREQFEYRIPAIPTSFEQDLINREEFMNGDLISVLTNLSVSNQPVLDYLSESSILVDDFDVISRVEFKTTKKIKARLRKSQYTPTIIVN